MTSGTFEEFLFDLRAFESGWDRPRYEAGIIADWQLDDWAGGTVQEVFPQYSSWGDLSAAEWDAMSYRSMNAFGFVGYQFGEALLIDLGYYDDDVYYLNGASTNTWDGTWTGKNGATSLDAFMTAAVQDRAILDAFGFNLSVIEGQLGTAGRDLSEFLGQTASYIQNGEQLTVELTLTGILAAAHLRGAWAVADLLLSGTLSFDEFGTSILQYVEQFGGYESPTIAQLIADWEAGKTGDEGLGQPGEDSAGGDDGSGGSGGGSGEPDGPTGSAGVTPETADVVIDWTWGRQETVPFDPTSDTIFIDWIDAEALDVFETPAGVVIAVPSNNLRVTLRETDLSELGPDNFTFNDSSAAREVLALIGPAASPPEDTPDSPPSAPGGDDDSFDGGRGPDRIVGTRGDDTIDGRAGRDTLIGRAGDDDIEGGVGGDILRGRNGNDTLDGAAGKDRLVGGNGNDDLDGGAGRDTLVGGSGNDTLDGGGGRDVFVYDSGRDTIGDFRPGRETLRIDDELGVATIGALLDRAIADDGDVVIRFGGGNRLRLEDITLDDLATSDVDFF